MDNLVKQRNKTLDTQTTKLRWKGKGARNTTIQAPHSWRFVKHLNLKNHILFTDKRMLQSVCQMKNQSCHIIHRQDYARCFLVVQTHSYLIRSMKMYDARSPFLFELHLITIWINIHLQGSNWVIHASS